MSDNFLSYDCFRIGKMWWNHCLYDLLAQRRSEETHIHPHRVVLAQCQPMFKGVFIPDKTSQRGVPQTNELGISERKRKTSERRWTATKTAPHFFLLLWEREQTCTQYGGVHLCQHLCIKYECVCVPACVSMCAYQRDSMHLCARDWKGS